MNIRDVQERQEQPPELFYKKVALKSFTKFIEHLYRSLFSNKVVGLACNFIIKETLAQVLPCEFFEVFKNTSFTKHL